MSIVFINVPHNTVADEAMNSPLMNMIYKSFMSYAVRPSEQSQYPISQLL